MEDHPWPQPDWVPRDQVYAVLLAPFENGKVVHSYRFFTRGHFTHKNSFNAVGLNRLLIPLVHFLSIVKVNQAG